MNKVAPHYKRVAAVSVAALKPYARNARTHSRKQVRQIAESIKTFGFVNPVLIDGENTILAGHGRVEAAKLLGLEAVPTLLVDHLSEDEKRAYILADNRVAELAGWDKELLALELQSLGSTTSTSMSRSPASTWAPSTCRSPASTPPGLTARQTLMSPMTSMICARII